MGVEMSRGEKNLLGLAAERQGAREPDSIARPSQELLVPSALEGFGSRLTNNALHCESLRSVMENYLSYYAVGESHTARAKRYDLQYFLEFLSANGEARVSDWTFQRTKDFVDYRLSLGEAPTTVSRRLATIKHFGRTLAERVPGYINPAREAKSPLLQLPRPHGVSAEEIEFLREAARLDVERTKGGFTAERNRFMLELLLATGLRADEVRLLVISQISEDLSWLKNVKTKGKRFRRVYLHSEIREELRRFLALRYCELQKKKPAVFSLPPSEQNKLPVLISLYRAEVGRMESFALSPKSVWHAIAMIGRRAQGLTNSPLGHLHPHRLRHAFAHGLLDSTKDVRLVAQALGHSDVRTTMRYTERTEQELAHAIEAKVAHERIR
jgi:site-specific recombinase XerD